MCCILITEGFAIEPWIRELTHNFSEPYRSRNQQENAKTIRTVTISVAYTKPKMSLALCHSDYFSFCSLFRNTVFPGCIHSHSLVSRAPRCPKSDSCVIQEYRKWALIISKPTAFGSKNLICVFIHNLHMQKASELNKGMDLVVGKGTALPAVLHEVLSLSAVQQRDKISLFTLVCSQALALPWGLTVFRTHVVVGFHLVFQLVTNIRKYFCMRTETETLAERKMYPGLT